MLVLVQLVRLGILAAFKFALQPFGELELALGVGDPVLLLLQLGVVVGELVEEDGNGHAVEDDAEGDAAEGHAAAQVGDRHHVAVADGGDAHLQGDTRRRPPLVNLCACVCNLTWITLGGLKVNKLLQEVAKRGTSSSAPSQRKCSKLK